MKKILIALVCLSVQAFASDDVPQEVSRPTRTFAANVQDWFVILELKADGTADCTRSLNINKVGVQTGGCSHNAMKFTFKTDAVDRLCNFLGVFDKNSLHLDPTNPNFFDVWKTVGVNWRDF